MIEAVTIDQEHFRVPTLRTDSRGLVIGERAILRFSILPQVVAFFQALTDEQSLDHMAQSLRLIKVRSRTTGLEILVDLPVQGSYLLDRAARIARMLRGEAYTGNWPHFVPYRDRQAPFGYDARELTPWQNGPVFYSRHGAQKLELTGEMAFESLVLDLSLDRVEPAPGNRCTLRVKSGLRASVQSFLWRRKVKASVAEVVREPRGKFDQAETLYLFDIPELPPRLFGLFEAMPGVEVYHTFGKNLYVQRGFRHPFAVENCRRFFLSEKLYLFSGDRDTVDLIDGDALTFVDLGDLRAQRFRVPVAEQIQKTGDLIGTPDAIYRGQPLGAAVEYKVQLVHIPEGGTEHITGVLIQEPREIAWLKRIVFSLPQAALESYRAAFTDHGVLVINPNGVELVPLGLPLKEVFPNVYLRAGMRFAPPIGFEHLARALAMTRGNLYVLPHGIEAPLEIPEPVVKPLVRYLLAEVDIARALDLAPASLENDRERGIPLKSSDAGLFALWAQNLFKPSITNERDVAALPRSTSASDLDDSDS